MNFVNCGVNTSISNYCFKKVSFFKIFTILSLFLEKIDQTFIDVILIFFTYILSPIFIKDKIY